MTSRQVRIHGGIKILGSTAEVSNLNLEHRGADDLDEVSGNIWFNEVIGRVEYAETEGAANSLRAIAHTGDIAELSESISTKVDAAVAALDKTVGQKLKGIVPVVSGTNTIIGYDNSTPLVTEGAKLWSATITPQSLDSNINIRFSGIIDASKINIAITVAIFRNNVLVGFINTGSSGYNGAIPNTFNIDINDSPKVITPVTYSCRIGTSSNASWYLGRGASYSQGGVNNSHWNITEEL